MSKRKKDVTQMTDDELERHLFPKKVVEELKRIAHEEKPVPAPQPRKNRSS